MKPLKSITPLARWMLRISLASFIYFVYFSTFKTFNFSNPDFYFAAIYVVFGALLFIGGFLRKSSLTVISGFVIFMLAVYQFMRSFSGFTGDYMLSYIMPASIAFYFLSTGNHN